MTKDNYSDIDLSWLEPMQTKTKQLQMETEQIKKETLKLKEDHFYLLCKSLLHSIDSGNQKAEESVLCRIRVAVRDFEYKHTKDE